MRLVLAALFVVSACGSDSRARGEPARPAHAGEQTLSRGALCFRLATHLCEANPGCSYAHRNDEYSCQSRFMYECCRGEGSCAQPVTVDVAQLSECERQAELSYDCNRTYTPACFEVVPGAYARAE